MCVSRQTLFRPTPFEPTGRSRRSQNHVFFPTGRQYLVWGSRGCRRGRRRVEQRRTSRVRLLKGLGKITNQIAQRPIARAHCHHCPLRQGKIYGTVSVPQSFVPARGTRDGAALAWPNKKLLLLDVEPSKKVHSVAHLFSRRAVRPGFTLRLFTSIKFKLTVNLHELYFCPFLVGPEPEASTTSPRPLVKTFLVK